MIVDTWKDIQGYEGFYQVSNLGRVKRLKMVDKANRNLPEKIMKSRVGANGYLKIGLTKDKKQNTVLVHRLVAINFIENKSNRKEVNHIDGNKLNNNVNNLEWNTPLENTRHSNKNGLVDIKGENNVWAKLNNKKVLIVRELLNKGESCRKIGERFGVSRSTIQSIKLRKNWKHI